MALWEGVQNFLRVQRRSLSSTPVISEKVRSILQNIFDAEKEKLLNGPDTESCKKGHEISLFDIALWLLYTPPEKRQLMFDTIKSMNYFVNEDDLEHKMSKFPRIVGWNLPEHNCYSVCTDASLKDGIFTIAAVIRDMEGEIITTCCGKVGIEQGVTTIQEAESFAIFEGVKLAGRHNCRRIVVESDSLNVVATIRDCNIPDIESERDMLLNILFELCSLDHWDIVHRYREGNTIVDKLAAYAHNEPSDVGVIIEDIWLSVFDRLVTSDKKGLERFRIFK